MDNQITHLTKVEIKELWGKYDIVWDLNPDVNVLAGINGSGKTTILNCIYELFFYNLILTDDRNMAKSVQLNFNNAASISFEEEISLSGLNEDSFQKLTNMNLIRTFDTELKSSEAIKKLSDERVKSELDWELYQLQEKYKDYQINIARKKESVFKDNQGNSLIDNIAIEFKKLGYPKERLLEIIDKLFSETNKKVNRSKNHIEFLLGDKEINPYQLSSGEKQLLIIFLTVLIQDNKPSILFMDEPELSLHIEWQRKLIKYIRELNPNVQLIIATHSPDIIMEGWMDKVFNMGDMIKDCANS